jgi:dTDP-4-dehydrorhamnose 3,5-epimerase
VLYKTTDFYHPECERTLAWNDSQVGIDWQLGTQKAILSPKDAQGRSFRDAETFE